MRFPAEPFSVSRSRRRFLTTTSLAAAAVWASRAEGRVLVNPSFSADPFALGVASGEPTPDGVVLWTRLAQKPFEPGGGMTQEAVEVSWEIADDEAFTKGVRRGTVTATPDWAHSVHVEVAGLEPARWYFYRFACGAATSPTGRTRTAPAADRPAERLTFGIASCQNWEEGLYTAYGQMAGDDLDLILHLGDYIYEHPARDKKARRHGPPTDSLAGFRARHALYKQTRSSKRPTRPARGWSPGTITRSKTTTRGCSPPSKGARRKGYSSGGHGATEPIGNTCRCAWPTSPTART